LQNNLEAEKGAAYHLCKTPEETITAMLNTGFTADCFTVKPLQELFGCIVECVGRGITERRGIAAELEHRGKLQPDSLKKIQQWLTGIPPEPDMQLEQAVKTLIEINTYNQVEDITTSFLKKIRPNQVQRNLPALMETLSAIYYGSTPQTSLPSEILNGPSRECFSTGYHKLDELLRAPALPMGGFYLGQMTTFVMPAKNGKSTMACNLAINAIRQKIGTIFFSMEMGQEIAMEWMLSNYAVLPLDLAVFPAKCNQQELESRNAALEEMGKYLRVWGGAAPLSEIRAKINSHKREFEAEGKKIGLVIVDWFDFITNDDNWDRRNDWAQRDSKAMKLANLFQETHTHGVVFNQMSEDGKKNWERNMSVSSAGLIRGGQSLYNASYNIIAGGRHHGRSEHNEYAYDPDKENVTKFLVKASRDKGIDIGTFELKFNAMYHRLEEL
jgi:hypothetical protein